jgi:hypothetical protein
MGNTAKSVGEEIRLAEPRALVGYRAWVAMYTAESQALRIPI